MEMTLFLVLGIALGGLSGWFLAQRKQQGFQQQLLRAQDREQMANDQLSQARHKLTAERSRLEDAQQRLARAEATIGHQETKLKEQEINQEELYKQFNQQFEVIASKMMRQNAEQLSNTSNEKLNLILNPLKERIRVFEESIQQSSKERSGLRGELREMLKLNQRMAEEAKNLTNALRGDTKKQGNWGEVILERILERSGLIRNEEYRLQVSTFDETQRLQPDAVIYLPENKHIIIDAKVSLKAWDQFINDPDNTHQQQAIKAHVLSVRNHIRQLGGKSYHAVDDFNSPDFVLLFMPVEAAFSAALQYDSELFNDAWDHKIVMVSPTTLLATLRTIASVWKQERQQKNAQEIARLSGKMYDKFVGFLDDMHKIENHLSQAHHSHEKAMNKLSSGRGNLIHRADQIKQLGADARKNIHPGLIEGDDDQ